MTDSPTVVYTDGACSGNPGPGGWGWVVPDGPSGSGGEQASTNQRMELAAVLNAVRTLPGPLHIVSDSTYVVNCFRDSWWKGWIKRGWKNSQKKPVANRDLWEPLIELYQERELTFEWVKGHSGDQWNDRADELAVAAVPPREPASPPREPASPPREPASPPSDPAEALQDEAEPNLFSAASAAGAPIAPIATAANRKIATVGLRPPELGGYDENPIAAGVRKRVAEILKAKVEMFGSVTVLTGLQLGAEQLAAEAATAAGASYVAVLAFPDPAARWPKPSRERFDSLLDAAADVVILSSAVPSSPRDVAKALGARDRWLQTEADEAIVIWDRSHAGVGAATRGFENAFGDDVWIVDPAEC